MLKENWYNGMPSVILQENRTCDISVMKYLADFVGVNKRSADLEARLRERYWNSCEHAKHIITDVHGVSIGVYKRLTQRGTRKAHSP